MVVTGVIDSLSALLREQKLKGSFEQKLRTLLNRLHDYKEALEEALNGGDVREALKLRQKLESDELL